jgi:hypothetical protein
MEALGMKQGDLPPYFERMKRYGFPPGYVGTKYSSWMCESILQQVLRVLRNLDLKLLMGKKRVSLKLIVITNSDHLAITKESVIPTVDIVEPSSTLSANISSPSHLSTAQNSTSYNSPSFYQQSHFSPNILNRHYYPGSSYHPYSPYISYGQTSYYQPSPLPTVSKQPEETIQDIEMEIEDNSANIS